MRFLNVFAFLGVSGLGVVTAATGGCGGGGTAGAGGSGSGSGGGSAAATCASKDASCTKVKSDCVAIFDNAGAKQFTLRMSQLSLTKPDKLASGLVSNVVQGGVLPNMPKCYLNGTATFSWLLDFDTDKMTIKTGGAKPVTDPTAGYSFFSGKLGTTQIDPVVATVPLGTDGSFKVTMPFIVNVPVFLDATGMNAVVLPLKGATVTGKVSADHNCIGKFNVDGLTKLPKAAKCVSSDPTTPTFLDDATLDGYMTLEDTDSVIITALHKSLCAFLSGTDDAGSPNALCVRDASKKITFMGDWCDAKNDASCKDSIKLGATFSASAVKLNP